MLSKNFKGWHHFFLVLPYYFSGITGCFYLFRSRFHPWTGCACVLFNHCLKSFFPIYSWLARWHAQLVTQSEDGSYHLTQLWGRELGSSPAHAQAQFSDSLNQWRKELQCRASPRPLSASVPCPQASPFQAKMPTALRGCQVVAKWPTGRLCLQGPHLTTFITPLVLSLAKLYFILILSAPWQGICLSGEDSH